MKIKKVELVGFKSFINRTLLAFPKGITAIVGPNGCGKSNIVDAIRWVLGEQNVRHLRGRIMEDLIFAGSETQKQVGMTEVVLTLSNENGTAPQEYINFSEIEISRKLFRSGESEYYINKVQSRLKDIVDLFTDTGIGTKAYSIIEQGQVGWLVTAKPDERRILFEEAAGINKYKNRKEAALRRLDATKENLIRVSDIISEVKRQLNSLNRQAKKAERYKLLIDELKNIELFLAFEEHNVLEDSKKEKMIELERLKEREMGISAGKNKKEILLEDLHIKHIGEEAELKEIRTLLLDIGNSIQTKERAVEVNALRIGELRRNEERLSKDIDELNHYTEKVGGELHELKKSLGKIFEAIKVKEDTLASEERVFSELSEAAAYKDKVLKDKNLVLADIIVNISQIKNALNVCLRDEELFCFKIDKMEKEKSEVEKILTDKERVISELNEKNKDLDFIKRDAEKREEIISKEISLLQEKLLQMDMEQKADKEVLATISSRLATLKEFEDSLEGFQDGIRTILKNKDTAGIHGILAEFIETSPEYEKAVEVVLGERLKYAVVGDLSDSIQAVEYLKTNELGRGSFIHAGINGYPSKVERQNPEVNGGILNSEPLINHIRVKKEYVAVINYILSDVFVAKNLKDAAAIWNLNGMNKTIVTMEGEVIDACGIVTGGSSREKAGGILQRKREIRELSAKADELKERTAERNQNVSDLKNEVDAANKELEGLKTLKHSKDVELAGIDGTIRQEESEFKRLKERLNVVNFEIEELKRQLTDAVDNKKGLEAKKELLEDSRNKTVDIVAALQDEVAGLTRKRESAYSSLTDIKVMIASLRERCGALEHQQNEKEGFIESAAGKIRAKRDEIRIGAEEIQEIDGNLKDIQREILDLLRKKDDACRIEAVKKENLSKTMEEIASIENEIKTMKSEWDAIHENINNINLELNGLELKSSHLTEKINEKYGVEIKDYMPSHEFNTLEKAAVLNKFDELKTQIDALGEVSLSALTEYNELEKRHQFLLDQQTDLTNSVEALKRAINRINRTTRQRFIETFDAINAKFQEVFPVFFPGGRAEIRLVDEEDILESGIEIAAEPSGKRLQSINLLSGGEKAMTATALIFSIFLIKPSPFCLLDEVDAPLDDANIGRFNAFLKEMAKKSQFILITHNKGTMEIADILFGITMEEPGVSKVVSVTLNS